MSGTRRILLSSRDPGGAGHLLALLEAFRAHGRFEIDVVASGVALRMLRDAGELPREFTFDGGRDALQIGEPADSLLSAARNLLDEVKPDVVLGTLSTYGAGIDEALAATASCAALTMQDFWGDVNLGLGVPSRLYLAFDDYAVQLTKQRWDLPAVAVGSPKHSRYARLDVTALRRDARASIGVSDSEQLIGFFGQSPDIPGHESAFSDLVHAAAGLNPQPVFLLRQHLKFQHRRAEHVALASAGGLRVVDVSDRVQAEPWLAACDVVATPFSLSALDHAYLSAYSVAPIGVVVFLLPNDEIQTFMQQACGLTEFPTVARGIGTVARRPEDIAPLLAAARDAQNVRRYFEASQVMRQEEACRHVVDLVESYA